MAHSYYTELPPRIELEIRRSALRTMHLGFDRARKRGAFPWWASCSWKHKRAFLRIYRKSAIKNYFAKDDTRYHVDHIVPLAGEHVCGLMVPWNLHVIPAVVNMAKGTMIVEEWHGKMPGDGRAQLRAAQERNREISAGYLARRAAREARREAANQRSPHLDVLFR